MGIHHRPKPELLDALGAALGFSPPREPGLDTVATIHALERGELDALVALGGNFLAAAPDTARTARGLERCRLTASVSTKLNRTHLYPGRRAVILPCLGRSERDEQGGRLQFVTVEDSMSMVHRSQGMLPPAGPDLRSEPAIVAALGAALDAALGAALAADRAASPTADRAAAPATDRAAAPGAPAPPRARPRPAPVPWAELAQDYDRIRALIERVIPGFERFSERVRSPDGFQLPNAARDRSFGPIGGRARFAIAEPPDLALPPGRLRMMTIRSHDQFNTTIYGLDDRYRGIRGERRVVLLHPADLAAAGLVEGQRVDLISEWTDGERVAAGFLAVPFEIPRGNAATYFPEANGLVPLASVADRSSTPTYKSVVIRLRPR
jgi:anaerobic selenocysteine-containing dehydrogenase